MKTCYAKVHYPLLAAQFQPCVVAAVWVLILLGDIAKPSTEGTMVVKYSSSTLLDANGQADKTDRVK